MEQTLTPTPFPPYPAAGPGYPRLPSPSQFRSFEEAEVWASGCWPHISFDFDELDPLLLLPFLQELHRLAQRWPEPMERLKTVRNEYGDLLDGHWVRNGGRTLILEKSDFINGKLAIEQGWREKTKKLPKGCGSVAATAAIVFGDMLDSYLTGYYLDEDSPNLAIPSGTAFCPYVSMWQEFGLVSRTFIRFKHTVRQRNLARELDRFSGEALANLRFSYGFASYLHTPAAEQVPYVQRLGHLLEALDRGNWYSDPVLLHQAGENLEEGFVILSKFAEQFGMDVELLRPIDEDSSAV